MDDGRDIIFKVLYFSNYLNYVNLVYDTTKIEKQRLLEYANESLLFLYLVEEG